MKKIKLQRLKKGDTIAIVSPSSGLPSLFPSVYEKGLVNLRELGFKIKEYPSARANIDFLRDNPKFRAKDINDAFKDKEIKAIFTSIGGNDSIRILPYLNENIIQKNPKILTGYSDTTTLHLFCNVLGIPTFYGPGVMVGYSQMKVLPLEFKQHICDFWFGKWQTYKYSPYPWYADGYPDWKFDKNIGKVNKKKKNSGWVTLQGKGTIKGKLAGGCIEVMEMLKGTRYWPPLDYWKNKIMILETSEEKPTLHNIDHELRSYGAQGIFSVISGLLIARARDFSAKEKEELNKLVVRIVSKEFKKPNLPIMANIDFGHTDPQFILPLGIKMELNMDKKTIRLLESPFI